MLLQSLTTLLFASLVAAQTGTPQQQQPQLPPKQAQQPQNGNLPPPPGGPDYGYQGYNVSASGPPGTAVYSTPNTEIGNSDENATAVLPVVPDIFLNASAHVGEISLIVENITAKVNVEAQVLKLLNFNAGVQASVDRVRLLIQGVEARVTLEARLENVVAMINDVLHAIDLKPILAHLSKDVNHIVNNAVNTLAAPVDPGTHSRLSMHVLKRRSDGTSVLEHGILYSINDYSGNAHTNRVLAQDGSLVDVFIDNQGHEHGYTVVGYYDKDMKYTGKQWNTTLNGLQVRELEYVYTPFPGIEAICGIYLDGYNHVSGTRVLAEIEGGASSTIF